MKRLTLLAAFLLGPQLHAQSDSTLLGAVRLATEGQRDSAWAVINHYIDSVTPADTAYPQALYTAGLIASDPDSARAYFRIVGIEYSQSEWADEALIRLSQLSFASGDPIAALRHANRVLRDYPFTEMRGEAGYWAGRSEMALGNLATGCDYLSEASIEAVENVELANRIAFHLQRCESADQQRPDSAAADTSNTGAEWWAVQVAALRSASAVDRVMVDLRAAGYEPRVSLEADGFLRVRVGRFRDRAAAGRLADEIGERVGGEPFVVEDR